MKIRSLNELEDALDSELAWRKKELSTLNLSAMSLSKRDFPIHARAMVPLLYAHWEGFAKMALIAYGVFVSTKKLPYDQLCRPLLYQELRANFNKERTLTSGTLLAVVDCIDAANSKRFDRFSAERVDTSSNLNRENTTRELGKLGLTSEHLETLFPKLDAGLLDKRNRIAHGERLDVARDDLEELYELTHGLIARLDNVVRNSAAQNSFRRVTYSADTARPLQTAHR